MKVFSSGYIAMVLGSCLILGYLDPQGVYNVYIYLEVLPRTEI